MKNFLSGFNVSGDVNFDVGKFNVSGDVNFDVNNFNLSGDKITIYGREALNLVYKDRLTIKYDNGTNLIDVATFLPTSRNPTIILKSTASVPVDCYAKHALWS